MKSSDPSRKIIVVAIIAFLVSLIFSACATFSISDLLNDTDDPPQMERHAMKMKTP